MQNRTSVISMAATVGKTWYDLESYLGCKEVHNGANNVKVNLDILLSKELIRFSVLFLGQKKTSMCSLDSIPNWPNIVATTSDQYPRRRADVILIWKAIWVFHLFKKYIFNLRGKKKVNLHILHVNIALF